MCGRTSLFAPRSTVESRFDATFKTDYEPRYNLSPGDSIYVIHDDDPNTIVADGWGFVPAWADQFDEGPHPINARVETVSENGLFRNAFESHRALVLADGYYEWAGNRGGKQPYRIEREDQQPFAMAGIWSRWKGEGRSRKTVAILTKPATDPVESIHDRMPVLLDRNDEPVWLQSDPTEAKGVLDSEPEIPLETYLISTLVNDPQNDSPAVVEPVGGDSGQLGLGDFGSD